MFLTCTRSHLKEDQNAHINSSQWLPCHNFHYMPYFEELWHLIFLDQTSKETKMISISSELKSCSARTLIRFPDPLVKWVGEPDERISYNLNSHKMCFGLGDWLKLSCKNCNSEASTWLKRNICPESKDAKNTQRVPKRSCKGQQRQTRREITRM